MCWTLRKLINAVKVKAWITWTHGIYKINPKLGCVERIIEPFIAKFKMKS